jgi:hypothetical protein
VGSLRLLYSEPGETLGPSGPGSSVVSMVFPFLKVLVGSGLFGVLHRFVDSPMSSFLFFWACFAIAPTFF